MKYSKLYNEVLESGKKNEVLDFLSFNKESVKKATGSYKEIKMKTYSDIKTRLKH